MGARQEVQRAVADSPVALRHGRIAANRRSLGNACPAFAQTLRRSGYGGHEAAVIVDAFRDTLRRLHEVHEVYGVPFPVHVVTRIRDRKSTRLNSSHMSN